MGKGIILVFLVIFAIYLPVKEVAGKDTQFLLELATKIAIDKWMYFLVCGLFGGGWYLERRSRQKYVKRHSGHEKHLQEKLDPGRGTSGLNEDGTAPRR